MAIGAGVDIREQHGHAALFGNVDDGLIRVEAHGLVVEDDNAEGTGMIVLKPEMLVRDQAQAPRVGFAKAIVRKARQLLIDGRCSCSMPLAAALSTKGYSSGT